MNAFGFALAALALAFVACSSSAPCGTSSSDNTDLGGWMVDEAWTTGVHQYCIAGVHKFVLQTVAEYKPDGGVALWTERIRLNVALRRGERLMFGFECGSAPGIRGDVIAVVDDRTDQPLRAWRVGVVEHRFVVVSAEAVTCQSLE